MDSKALMAAYMRAKNYTKYAEVCQDLGFSSAHIAEIKKGKKQFTDETAIFLAEGAGLDPLEVMISLQAVRAKTPMAKAAWYDALKKYCASTGTALAVGLMTMGTLEIGMALTASKIFLC
ncbi:transcriptional regulator [Aeromonas taiwanensis]|uniref:transcriptional regulator n=1 Tax=Aeromonas taiwanensis TaxID=633417 RepID=UPI003BA08D58